MNRKNLKKNFVLADAAGRHAHVQTGSVRVPVHAKIAPVIAIFVRNNKKQVRSFCRSRLHCMSCSMLIEKELMDIGVDAVCNYAGGYVDVVFDEKRILETDIIQAITKMGYAVVKKM